MIQRGLKRGRRVWLERTACKGAKAKVAQGPTGYGGQGFSLRGEKSRYVLPPAFRKAITDNSDQRVLCLARHDRWPCLSGFGLDRPDTFEALLDKEEDRATRLGQDFDRELRSMNLWNFEQVPFDSSGRFVLPDTLAELGGLGNSIYFQGIGPFLTLWDPARLYAMGTGFEGPQAYCRKAEADAAGKAKGKGSPA